MLSTIRRVIGTAVLLRAVIGVGVLANVLAPGVMSLPLVPGLPRLTLAWLPVFALTWVGLAVAFLLGCRTGKTGPALGFVMLYVVLMDEQTYSNHLYLMAIVVALLGVASRAAVTLLKAQVSIVYGFAAVAKVNGPYLSGEVLDTILRPAFAPLATIMAPLSVVALAALAVGLWTPWRRAAAILGASLHVGMMVTFQQEGLLLALFAVEMVALYPLFFAASNGCGAAAAPKCGRGPSLFETLGAERER